MSCLVNAQSIVENPYAPQQAACCQGSKRATQAPLLCNIVACLCLWQQCCAARKRTPCALPAGWLCPFKRCGHPTPHAEPPTRRSAHFVCVSRARSASQSVCRARACCDFGSALLRPVRRVQLVCSSAAVRLHFGFARPVRRLLNAGRAL